MPTQEENARIRYETLKEIIKLKGSINGDLLFAEMFDRFGIIERTTSRYLKFLKLKKYVEINGDIVLWNTKRKPETETLISIDPQN